MYQVPNVCWFIRSTFLHTMLELTCLPGCRSLYIYVCIPGGRLRVVGAYIYIVYRYLLCCMCVHVCDFVAFGLVFCCSGVESLYCQCCCRITCMYCTAWVFVDGQNCFTEPLVLSSIKLYEMQPTPIKT